MIAILHLSEVNDEVIDKPAIAGEERLVFRSLRVPLHANTVFIRFKGDDFAIIYAETFGSARKINMLSRNPQQTRIDMHSF